MTQQPHESGDQNPGYVPPDDTSSESAETPEQGYGHRSGASAVPTPEGDQPPPSAGSASAGGYQPPSYGQPASAGSASGGGNQPPSYGQPPSSAGSASGYGQDPQQSHGQPTGDPGYGQQQPYGDPNHGQQGYQQPYGQQPGYPPQGGEGGYDPNQQYAAAPYQQQGYPPQGYQPQQAPMSPSDERLWATLTHISIPFFTFIVPLIAYLVFKDRSPWLRQSVTEALNFSILYTIAYVVSAILVSLVIGLILWPLVAIAALGFCILAAIASNKGGQYRYPINWRMIK